MAKALATVKSTHSLIDLLEKDENKFSESQQNILKGRLGVNGGWSEQFLLNQPINNNG